MTPDELLRSKPWKWCLDPALDSRVDAALRDADDEDLASCRDRLLALRDPRGAMMALSEEREEEELVREVGADTVFGPATRFYFLREWTKGLLTGLDFAEFSASRVGETEVDCIREVLALPVGRHVSEIDFAGPASLELVALLAKPRLATGRRWSFGNVFDRSVPFGDLSSVWSSAQEWTSLSL